MDGGPGRLWYSRPVSPSRGIAIESVVRIQLYLTPSSAGHELTQLPAPGVRELPHGHGADRSRLEHRSAMKHFSGNAIKIFHPDGGHIQPLHSPGAGADTVLDGGLRLTVLVSRKKTAPPPPDRHF